MHLADAHTLTVLRNGVVVGLKTGIASGTWYPAAQAAGSSYAATVTNSYSSTTPFLIGGLAYQTGFTGYVDEVRVTKGLARYTGTGSFTPPSSAFLAY